MNNKISIIGGIVLLIIILLGGVLLFINNNSSEGQEEPNQFNENLIEMSAEEVGLTLSTQQNNQQIVMVLTKLEDIESFEFELSYDAVENGEVVSRGTFGSGPNSDEKNSSTIERVMDLGTCSAGKCRYDSGVEEAELSLRINLKNGEIGIIEEVFVIE